MGRAPCCSKVGLHKGPWTPREDALLTKYIQAHGEGQWKSLPKKAGLLRCGKSCRLRWMNYLRPDIKRGNITPEEDDLIIRMHSLLGNKWSLIAGRLPGRTDNEIKNYWNTHLSKKVKSDDQGADLKNQEQEGPSCKKKSNDDGSRKKSKSSSSNKKKQNKKGKKNNKGSNNDDEPQKTQVYLPKPIRVKPSCLPRTDSTTTTTTTFTFDSSNNSLSPNSGSTSQEKEEEENHHHIPKTKELEQDNNNMFCGGNLEDNNDGFGFFCDDYDLVNNSEMECQSYLATDHGTLEKLYEEYLQLLNVEDNMFELDSFAESLMV